MKKPELSPRESAVLRLIMKEHTSLEIAGELKIGVRTVETIRKNIFVKTGTNNVVALVKFTLKNQLIESLTNKNQTP